MKALLVSESRELSQTVSLILKVRWPELSLAEATKERESIELINREQPHIVMLHLDSARLDCFDLIGQIRGFSNVPVIVLSESDDVVDKVRALETGADDWIAPSSIPMEFIAKVNAVLRRCSPGGDGRVSCFLDGRVTMDCITHGASVLGKEVKLTPIEHNILCHLVRNEGSIVSSAALLHSAWGPDYRSDPEFLKKYIYRLRSKLEDDPTNPQVILTERGVGYAFVAPVSATE